MQSDINKDPDSSLCSQHGKAFSSSSCERCGGFFCEQCYFDAAFTPRCAACQCGDWTRPTPRRITPLSHIVPSAQIGLLGLILGLPALISIFGFFVLEPRAAVFSCCSALCGFSALYIFSMFLSIPQLRSLNSKLVLQSQQRRAAEIPRLVGFHLERRRPGPVDPSLCLRCDEAPPGTGPLPQFCEPCAEAIEAALCALDSQDAPPPTPIRSPLVIDSATRFVLWLIALNLFLLLLSQPLQLLYATYPHVAIAIALFIGAGSLIFVVLPWMDSEMSEHGSEGAPD